MSAKPSAEVSELVARWRSQTSDSAGSREAAWAFEVCAAELQAALATGSTQEVTHVTEAMVDTFVNAFQPQEGNNNILLLRDRVTRALRETLTTSVSRAEWEVSAAKGDDGSIGVLIDNGAVRIYTDALLNGRLRWFIRAGTVERKGICDIHNFVSDEAAAALAAASPAPAEPTDAEAG